MGGSCQTVNHSHIGVMWKTVSEDCNLACDYCYYSTCGGKPGAKIRRIDSAILEKFIKEYMAKTHGTASFAWQGGEPLLAGYDFFEQLVALQASYAPPHTAISNALQSNGTLVNDKWAAFFKQYNFLIGISLDGPKEIHDKRRVDANGQGSFERVMRGISYLQKHQVDFNILTVIHQDNVAKAKELMQFYKEQKFDYVQFIPCMDFHSQDIHAPGVYEITPLEYGQFLCEAFDIWYNDGQPTMSVRFFDNMLSVYMRREAELCVHRSACPKTLILEQNGDAYPCDFYIHPEMKLGNVGVDSLDAILDSRIYGEFAKMKPQLPDKCKSCQWLELCHGGCPRNRRWDKLNNEVFADYFCASYMKIYSYAHERMRQLGDAQRQEWFKRGVGAFYKGKLPGRNDPCACGSGRKYKQCCLG